MWKRRTTRIVSIIYNYNTGILFSALYRRKPLTRGKQDIKQAQSLSSGFV